MVKTLTYQELKTYKHSPEVRAAMALLQRETRDKRKTKMLPKTKEKKPCSVKDCTNNAVYFDSNIYAGLEVKVALCKFHYLKMKREYKQKFAETKEFKHPKDVRHFFAEEKRKQRAKDRIKHQNDPIPLLEKNEQNSKKLILDKKHLCPDSMTFAEKLNLMDDETLGA